LLEHKLEGVGRRVERLHVFLEARRITGAVPGFDGPVNSQEVQARDFHQLWGFGRWIVENLEFFFQVELFHWKLLRPLAKVG
jgi:hypothetical protein